MKINIENKMVINFIILGMIFTIIVAGFTSNLTSNRQKLAINNLKYNKENLEITGNIRLNTNNTTNVSLDFYDDQGYLGYTTFTLNSSDNRIFRSSKIVRDPVGLLRIETNIIG